MQTDLEAACPNLPDREQEDRSPAALQPNLIEPVDWLTERQGFLIAATWSGRSQGVMARRLGCTERTVRRELAKIRTLAEDRDGELAEMILGTGLKKRNLAQALVDRFGVSRSAAYRSLDEHPDTPFERDVKLALRTLRRLERYPDEERLSSDWPKMKKLIAEIQVIAECCL